MEANNNTRMLEFRGYTPNEISGAVWPFATGKPHTAMPNSFVPTAMPMQPASARKIYPTIRVRAEAARSTNSAVDVRIRSDSFISVEKTPISVCGEFITTERAVMIL